MRDVGIWFAIYFSPGAKICWHIKSQIDKKPFFAFSWKMKTHFGKFNISRLHLFIYLTNWRGIVKKELSQTRLLRHNIERSCASRPPNKTGRPVSLSSFLENGGLKANLWRGGGYPQFLYPSKETNENRQWDNVNCEGIQTLETSYCLMER